jgi:hypothetical protein
MPLRRKALFIVSLASLGPLFALTVIVSLLWLDNTNKLEQQQAWQNASQITQALASELRALDRFVGDWAGWDDTYQFAVDRNPDYIASNLTDETFSKDQISAFFVIDAAGQIVYSRTFDYEAGQPSPVSAQWAAYLPALARHSTITSSITGLVLVDQMPLLVASRPILNSNYEGPSHGLLVVGRALAAHEIRRLEQITGLQLAYSVTSAAPQPPDFARAYQALYRPQARASEKTPLAVYRAADGDITLSSYILIDDVLGQPELLLRAQTPRQIYQQVKSSIVLIVMSLLLTCLFFGALTLVLLDRTLLRRLAQLGSSVNAITASSDLAARVPVAGKDELTRLVIQINDMLTALEEAELDKARLYQETRRQLNELTLLHTAAMTAASSLTLDEALQAIAQAAYETFHAVNALVALCLPTEEVAEIRAIAGLDIVVMMHRRLPLSEGLLGWVVRTGKAVLVNDVTRDPRYRNADARTRSEICAPLRLGNRVIGLINVESDRLDAFTAGDLQLLETLAHNLSFILENLRLLEELRAVNDQLQEADRLKSRFFAVMSHELRTPLNSILGFSELLSDEIAGPLNAEQHDYVQHIDTSGRHLLNLINDILDLSKLQAGRLTLEQHSFRLSEVWADVQALIGPIVQRGQHVLRFEVPPDLPGVYADRLRVKQVLVNLLSNAAKFTPPAGVLTVGAEVWQAAWLRVRVSDTGPGIPLDQQAEIFKEFSLLSQKHASNGGSGLGLSITRQLIELHGGELWVESAGLPGQGATFYFTLPLAEKVCRAANPQRPP